MGPKNLLILFFSTVAVSLVILIIFFSLFFKNVNLDFNTRLPESAPDIGGAFNQTSTMSPDSKAEGLTRSTVNVPSDSREVDFNGKSGDTNKKDADEAPVTGDVSLPPISDDALLENEYPQPLPDKLPPPPTGNEKQAPPSNDKSAVGPSGNRSSMTAPPPRSPRPSQGPSQEIRREAPPVQAMPQPMEAPMGGPEPEVQQGPPVP
jgi:hypothetical protein